MTIIDAYSKTDYLEAVSFIGGSDIKNRHAYSPNYNSGGQCRRRQRYAAI